MSQTVLLEREDHLATIVLNRPEVLNAIDNTLATELTAACAQTRRRSRGLGGHPARSGRAGLLRRGRPQSPPRFHPDDWAHQRALLRGLFAHMRNVPQPMIAAVHGYALGGGTEFAMLADFIVASEDAVFGLTEVSLGIIPGGGGTQNLPRMIGRNRAKELIFSARRIPASEAYRLGLVNHVVPRAELLPTSHASWHARS